MADQENRIDEKPLDEEALNEVVGGTRPQPVRGLLRSSLAATGPTLAAKGGGDVAMESITLTYEKLEP